MNNLPPPNWSPTGNSGAWHWGRYGEKDQHTDEARECWKWFDDVVEQEIKD